MTDSATFTLRPIPKAAFIAGYAGLLPQVIAAIMVLSGSEYQWTGLALAYGYAAFIFSFIGGMWWALGMTTRISLRTSATLQLLRALYDRDGGAYRETAVSALITHRF